MIPADHLQLVHVCVRVCLSIALWKNGGLDPDAVWHGRSDGSMDDADSRVWGSVNGMGVILGANMGRPIVTNVDYLQLGIPIALLRGWCLVNS